MAALQLTPTARNAAASPLHDAAFWWAALAYLLFSANEVVTKWVYTVEPHVDGLSLSMLRTVLATVMFTLLAVRSADRPVLDRWTSVAVPIFGIGSAASTFFFNQSLTFLDYPATGAAIITLSPLVLGLYGSLMTRRALSGSEWAALVLGALGIGVFFADSLLRERGVVGVLLMLGAVFSWAVYPAFAGRRGSSLWMYAATSWVATVLLGMVSVPWLQVPVTVGGWIGTGFLGILVLGLATYSCVRAFALPGGLRWAKLNYAKPAVSVLLTLAVFGVGPTLPNLLGTVVITAALLLPMAWERLVRAGSPAIATPGSPVSDTSR